MEIAVSSIFSAQVITMVFWNSIRNPGLVKWLAMSQVHLRLGGGAIEKLGGPYT